MWDRKELILLQQNLNLLYKKARQRNKTMKRDVRKLELELQRKRDLVMKRPKNVGGEDVGLSFTDSNDNDLLLSSKNKDAKQRICGVMNSRGNPCQRTGFCPFHHKFNPSSRIPQK